MSERVPNIYQKTHALPDELTLWVNKKIYAGWEDMSFTRELNSCASDFSLSLTDRWEEGLEPWRITAGSHAHIHIGKISMIEGWVDSVEASVSASRRGFTARGRSATCDLVDCSADIDGSQLKNLNLKEIATKLLAPFKIPLTFSVDPGASFDTLTISPGETVFSILDKLARQRKLIIYPTRGGGLIFTKVSKQKSSTELVLGKNVLNAKSNYDFTNRFSDYIVKGQNLGFLSPGKEGTQPMGVAKDLGITRYRPMLLNAETASDTGTGENRAAYEAGIRKANSLKVEVQVQGFYQKDQTLWDVNQYVFVDIPYLGVQRWMLTKKCNYNKQNGGGTTTTIELVLPDSFDFQKEKPKEDALGWSKPLIAKPLPKAAK